MRIRPVLHCAAALAALVLCGTSAKVELPRDMVREFPKLAERIKHVYGHGTFVGKLKVESPQSDKFCEQDFIYRAAGDSSRVDLTTRAQKGTKFKVGGIDMFMAAPYASLHTYRRPDAKVFDTADQQSYKSCKARIDEAFPVSKLFSLGGSETVLELLRSSQVRVTAVKRVRGDGADYVKITFEPATGIAGRKAWSSWVALSPSEGWALREYSRTTTSGQNEVTHRGKIKYDGMHDDVPLVKQIETWREEGPQHKVVQHEVITTSDFIPGDPDHDYFAAFGLGPGRNPGNLLSPSDKFNRRTEGRTVSPSDGGTVRPTDGGTISPSAKVKIIP